MVYGKEAPKESTPTTFKALVTCIMELTNPSFLLFLIFAFILRYKFSIKSGTASNAVGLFQPKVGSAGKAIFQAPLQYRKSFPHPDFHIPFGKFP